MNTLFIGQKTIRLKRTGSTNSYLTNLTAKEKLSEGTVVITQMQERGKGQRGTFWESEPGKNLTLSILLEPTFLKPDEQFILNKVVSLAVLEFVCLCLTSNSSPRGEEHKRSETAIKWPNDIYIGTKKIAGILIENSVSGNKLQQSIIGIGINVNQENFSKKLPNPTSFKIVSGKYFDLDECLSQLFTCVESRYLQLKAKHLEKSNKEYLQNLYRFQEWAVYNYKGEKVKAKITGVTKIGKLVLEKENEKSLECDFKEVVFCN